MKTGIAAAALCALTFGASAEVCKPLTKYASIPLETSSELRRLYVPVEIGGKPMKLLLDTGASITHLNTAAAKALALETHKSPVRVYDLTGKWSDRYVETSFKVGGMLLPKYQFQVSEQFEDPDEPDVVGLLGANFLSVFDLSIDPAGKTLDLISPDHCPDKVIYWSTTAIAKVPFKYVEGGSIVVDIKLDGKPVNAILDTGAYNSTLRIDVAERMFDITPGEPDTPVVGVLNSAQNLTTYRHTFKTLDFEGVTVANLPIELIPDKLTRTFTEKPTGSLIGVTAEGVKPPMLIGMDILRHTRFYIAYKARMLYITPPSGPAPKSEPK